MTYPMVFFFVLPALLIVAIGMDCETVDVASTVTSFSKSSATAGQPLTFTVQLFSALSQPACIFSAALLTVQCLGRGNDSFCQLEPSIQPLGHGTFHISVWPMTFWAALGPWPPCDIISPAKVMDPRYPSCETTIQITYEGKHVKGSPFPVIVDPAEFSPAASIVHVLSSPFGTAGTVFPVARFYQITDRFTNWMRHLDFTDQLRVESSSPMVNMTTSWWSNCWMDIFASSNKAGTYNFRLIFSYLDGNEEVIPVNTSAGVDYIGRFEVRAGPLSVEDFLVYGLPATAEAGTAITVMVQALDRLQNPTALAYPGLYSPHVEQEQDASLLQVKVYLPSRTTMLLAMQVMGGTGLGLTSSVMHCYLAGAYKVEIVFQAPTPVLVYNGSFKVHPAHPSPRSSKQILPNSVEAGVVTIELILRDEWGNPSLIWDMLRVVAVHERSNVTPNIHGPTLSPELGLIFYSAFTLAGVYKTTSYIDGCLFQDGTTQVSPQRHPSLQRSQVVGYGAGIPYGHLSDVTALIAGNTYQFCVLPRDDYGNNVDCLDTVTATLDGPNMTSVTLCGTRSFRDNQSSIEYMYSINYTGVYWLTIHIIGQVFHKAVFQVLPGDLGLSATKALWPELARAGTPISFNVPFYDFCGNMLNVTGILVVMFKSYSSKAIIRREINVHDAVNVNFVVTLHSPGLYAGSCYFNNKMVCDVCVLEVTAVPINIWLLRLIGTGSPTCPIITASMLVLDMFGKIVLNPSLLIDLALSFETNFSWEATISYKDTGFQLVVWSGPIEQSVVSIAYRDTKICTYRWSSWHKKVTSRHILRIVVTVFSASALGCSALCLTLALFFTRNGTSTGRGV
nr:plus gametic plasma membrane protein [Volvox reticuliferus]